MNHNTPPSLELRLLGDRARIDSEFPRAMPTHTEADVFQRFKPTAMERFFSFDHYLFGFRSKYIALTSFDSLPGSGSLVVLHCVAVLAGVLLSVRSQFIPAEEEEGLSSCLKPISDSGVQIAIVIIAYFCLCLQSFSNLVCILFQHRLIFYNRSMLYQAKKLQADPAGSRYT